MTPLKTIALRESAVFPIAAAAIGLGIVLAIAPTSAHAEIQVRGTPQAVVVEAQNATVEEILVALTDAFKVEFRSAANLDKRLSGTYQGTLPQAVSHILKGYDFVVKSGQAGLEITLLGAGKPVVVLGTPPATKSANAAPAAAPTASPMASNHPVPMPSSGGPTPPLRVAQGPLPVPTPPAPGAAPLPMPQIGPSTAPPPMPPQPGAAPTPVPPLPSASSSAPQPPTGTPSMAAPPIPVAPPSPQPGAPPAR